MDNEETRKLKGKLAEYDDRLSALVGKANEDSGNPDDFRIEFSDKLQDAVLLQEGTDGELPPIDIHMYGSEGVLVKTTLRSGRMIKYVGSVTVIGDVNPGAQIIAGGDIVIWGRLRGIAHAGANGDETAIICAMDLRPQQLRIASFVAVGNPQDKCRQIPEMAYIDQGHIVAREWEY